jgi:hypothetical protein
MTTYTTYTIKNGKETDFQSFEDDRQAAVDLLIARNWEFRNAEHGIMVDFGMELELEAGELDY